MMDARTRRLRANTPSLLPRTLHQGLPNGPPQVVAGIKTFDGKGNLTQRDYRGDSLRTTGQTDFSPEGQETGTYTVNPDCTGSDVLNLNVPGTPPPHGRIEVVFVISDGG